MSDYDDDESVPQGTYRVVRDADEIMVGVMCNGEEIMAPWNNFTF